MRNEMFVASEEPTAGSVIANAERISPFKSGVSQSRRIPSLPYMFRISMLPVSGAWQFNTSEENGTLPNCSEIGA